MASSITITTIDDLEVALKISETLIRDGLAKCIWRDEIISSYLWEGDLVSNKEYRLFIKSKKSNFEKIKSKITKMHNYELPGIIQIDISNGNKNFLEWLER